MTINVQEKKKREIKLTRATVGKLLSFCAAAFLGLAASAFAANTDAPSIPVQPLLGSEFPVNCQLPLGWTTPGTATTGWSIDFSESYSGSCSLRSNFMTDSTSGYNHKAQIQVTGTFSDSALRFAAKVSSEQNWDCLRVFIDGVEGDIGRNCSTNGAQGMSGEVDWKLYTIPVPNGVHTILFSYEKDTLYYSGADAAWIDEVEIIPMAPFPPGCAIPSGWVTSPGANAGWSPAVDSIGSGTCSLKSGAIPNSGRADIQFTGTFVEGTVSFARRVSSSGGDCLRFYIDGFAQNLGNCDVALGVGGGVGAWGTVEIPIDAGTHVLRWSYQKDGSFVFGSDAAWIDNVVLPPRLPGPPTLDFINRDTEGNGTFSYSPPDDEGSSPILYYIVRWTSSKTGNTGSDSGSFPFTFTLSTLVDHPSYTVTMSAVNEWGEGPAATVNTGPDPCGGSAQGYALASVGSYDGTSTFTFAARPVHGSGTVAITITNGDNSRLFDFSLQSDGGDFSLNPTDAQACQFIDLSQTCQLHVDFSPTASGTRTGTLTILGPSNVRCTSENKNYTLTGNGTMQNQTITFTTVSAAAFGSPPFTLSANATSGLPVAFSSTTPSVCTVSGDTVSLAGVGTCTIAADQAGNEAYNPAPQVTRNIAVAKGSQTITFGALSSKTLIQSPVPVSATASSFLAVAFSSTTPSVCTVSGSSVTLVGVGTCTIAANQAGNANYLAAPQVTQSFAVTKASQTITFGTLGSRALNQSPFNVDATASSSLTVAFSSTTQSVCTVSGKSVTLLAVGTCTIHADQPGNATYLAAPQVTQSFSVATANQTITFAALSTRQLGEAPFNLSAHATSDLPVVFSSLTTSVCTVSGATVTLVAAGTCTIAADQPGNATYVAAPQVTQSFQVQPPASPARLINLSTRGQVLVGDEVMIAGFIIEGSASKRVVIRAKGPSLTQFGVNNALPDPTLRLVRFSDNAVLATNDNFGTASNVAELQATGLAPDNALDSAILASLVPGGYTAIVSGVSGTTGVGLVEVFEVDRPDVPLINISTRGRVGTGDNVMIGGFVVGGTGPRTVVITAKGPTLAGYGVPGTLGDPKLTLVRIDGSLIEANDNWGDSPNKQALIASGFAGDTILSPLEPALRVTLDPGNYTVIVSGVNNATGVVLLEINED